MRFAPSRWEGEPGVPPGRRALRVTELAVRGRVPRGNNWECDGTGQVRAKNLGLTLLALGTPPRNGSSPVLESAPAPKNVYNFGEVAVSPGDSV